MTFTTPRVRYLKPGSMKDGADLYGHIAIIVNRAQDLAKAPFGSVLLKRLKTQEVRPVAGTVFTTQAPNETGSMLAVGFADKTLSPFALLELARKLTGIPRGTGKVCLMALGLTGEDHKRAINALTSCIYARAPLPDFKGETAARPVAAVDIYGADDDDARLRAGAYGNHLARTLSILPGNHLTPSLYVKRIKQWAADKGWKFQFLDEKRLAARGAGAFLAVTRTEAVGSGIVHLRYSPRKVQKNPIALVGKGICFDTGGVNVKPARHMYGMHEDMEGSAVALGTLLALSELKVPYVIDCYLAIAENAIGPRSYRPNDVVRATNGTTIEIVHTDAEGRMVLADTLSLACESHPGLVLDYATLTGACVNALGTRMSGVFTNRPMLTQKLIEAGHTSGERVWPFPLEDDYDAELKSDIADVKQCTLEGEADHILAALFLKRFLAHDPIWIHMDLSAGRHKGGLGAVPSDTTGFGVHYTLALLSDPTLHW